MEEIWADVYFNGAYVNRKISNLGNMVMDSGKACMVADNGAGYLTYPVCSWKEDGIWKSKRDYIHRLVAKYFIPNPDDLSQVNHIDCDKSNNCVSNLEWTSGATNIVHAHKMGRMKNRTDIVEVVALTVAQVIDLYTSVKRDRVGISAKARQMEIPRTTASSIMNKRSRSTITDRIDAYLRSPREVFGPMPTIKQLGFAADQNLRRVEAGSLCFEDAILLAA